MARKEKQEGRVHVPRLPYTEERAQKAIDALRETGSVMEAARVSGVPYRTIYHWRTERAEFGELYQEALDEGIERLESEAQRRALGYEEPVYQSGRLVGHIKRYSDTLLIFLLKANRPDKYREKWQGELKAGGSLQISFTPEESGED